MKIRHIAFLSVFAFHSVRAGDESQKNANAGIRQEFETLARETSYFEISDVLYRRAHPTPPSSQVDASKYSALIANLLSVRADKDALIALLNHNDPKVRTLAIAALASQQDPTVLPFIAGLLSDDAITFSVEGPEPQQVTARFSIPIRKDVTVGENARAVLTLYLDPAGYGGDVDGRPIGQKFADYWSLHKGRHYCASWFVVRLREASISGTGEYAEERRRTRSDLDKVPQPDRTWLGLWLNETWQNEGVFSKAELLGMCRKLGPDALMDALKQQRFPSDDPDLHHNFNFVQTAKFILRNADSLLRSQDSRVLVTLNSGDNCSPWWFIAAAQLQPAKAAEILRPAYAQFPEAGDRVTLGIALWRLGGESQAAFLTDRFYDAALARAWNDGWENDFFHGIAAAKKPSGGKLVATILQDKRLDDLKMDREILSSIVQAVNGWSKKPIVSEAEVEEATKDEGGKGMVPYNPANLPLKVKLLHRMRDSAPLWNT